MTLEQVITYQSQNDLGAHHIVWIGEEYFSLAHTNAERAIGYDHMQECPVAEWLRTRESKPIGCGLYIMSSGPGDDGYEFWPLTGN